MMWNLIPQPIKEEHKELVESLIVRGKFKDIKKEYFDKFEKGKHITWQQYLILKAIENDLKNGKKVIKISVSSGHGIGKSVVLAWLILWMLFCYKNAQIPTTAPTAEQMHDILWKELASWHKKMPKEIQGLYDWSSGYMRITESPETWFARAKTARKENPEALAGVHSDYVMVIADEASGVPDEIFNTAEGAMTGSFVIVVLISNPTRLVGYFYDTHHSDSKNWITLQFSSNDSPIVDKQYVERIIEKHGEDSDEYCIRVTGDFPRADAVDDQGYVPLILEEDLKFIDDMPFVGNVVEGIDPAGEGKDETTWVGRDQFKAKVIADEKISSEKTIAEKTLTIGIQYGINDGNVYVDNFGKGANVAQELGIAGHRVNGINVGMKAYDDQRFANLRSEACWKMKEWLRQGGELVKDDRWKELLYLRYKMTLGGKIQVMPKLEIKKKLGKSPDVPDALMLTFIRPPQNYINRSLNNIRRKKISSNRRLTM